MRSTNGDGGGGCSRASAIASFAAPSDPNESMGRGADDEHADARMVGERPYEVRVALVDLFGGHALLDGTTQAAGLASRQYGVGMCLRGSPG
jgi:hypothetical protein